MGGHREAELLPQVGRCAATGHSFTTDLHQCRETQPHDSTVSPINDINENRLNTIVFGTVAFIVS